MRIACLGWGSLIWDPRSLPIQRVWFEDGPLVPVEFARQSGDGRVTLVVQADAEPVRVLWALMLSNEVHQARASLGDREGIRPEDRGSRVGAWQRREPAPEAIPELAEWAQARGIEAVVWTALGPRFKGRAITPSAEEVVEYLRGLAGAVRSEAERYVRSAPRQINTAYRRRIETELGWSYRVP